jgi:hypothetical protein
MAETVHVTIQVRDMDNNARVTEKFTAPLERVREKAAQAAGRAAQYFETGNFEEPSSVPHVVDGKQRAAGDY